MSKIWELIPRDYLKGLVVAVFTGILTLLYQMLISQSVIELKQVTIVGLIAGLGYILQKLPQDEGGKYLGKY
jgi:hypothetical protein